LLKSHAVACPRLTRRSPPERDRADRADPGARVRQQPRLPARRPATPRPVGEQSPRAQADRTRKAPRRCGV